MDEIRRLVITLEVTREPLDYKTNVKVIWQPADADAAAAAPLTVQALVATVQEIIAELVKDYLTHFGLTEGVSNG